MITHLDLTRIRWHASFENVSQQNTSNTDPPVSQSDHRIGL